MWGALGTEARWGLFLGLLQLDHHEDQAFFAIYDGHCGVRAAAFAKVRRLDTPNIPRMSDMFARSWNRWMGLTLWKSGRDVLTHHGVFCLGFLPL